MKRKFIYLFSAFLLIFNTALCIRVKSIQQIFSTPTVIPDSAEIEKVHLQLDKPYYVGGDHIWFKAYVLNGYSLEPSKMSSVLYVDLIHGASIIKSLKLPLDNGVASGDFMLSDSISEGGYRIRAYTRWMRNEGEKFFFDKEVLIGSRRSISDNNKVNTKVNKSSIVAHDIKFFPEGGRLIKGIPTRIAIRALDMSGNGELISGAVDINGESVKISTNEFGHGSFMINTTSLDQLKAVVTFMNGDKKEYYLPKIEESGYSLMLKNLNGANRIVQIYLSADLLNKGILSLVGQNNGRTYFSIPVSTSKQLATMYIPMDKLPSGIIQLNLLDSQRNLVAERFLFNMNMEEYIRIDISGLQEKYSKRSPVLLTLDTKQFGEIVKGSFSISVTNSTVVGNDIENETNILSSFLLTSESTLPIKRPNYYLSELGKQDIDLLMITGSWRNVPKPGNKKAIDLTFSPEPTMSITGTLINNGKPISNGKITLMKSAGGIGMISTISDLQGKFRFDSLSFPDSTKLLLQARSSDDKKNVKILIDQIPEQEVTKKEMSYSNNEIIGKLYEYAQKSEGFFREQEKRISLSGTNQLKEVEIAGSRTSRDNNFVKRHGKADQEFSSKELDSAAFLSQVLNGKVRGNFMKYRVILDGIYVSPTTFFLNTDPTTLERIEVLSSPHLLAAYRSILPIMIVTSKQRPTLNTIKYAPGITTLSFRGYSYGGIFQSPDYEASPDIRPDLRTTVYWNPNITPDESGKLNIKYFNTDLPGKYRIVIEGIGGNRGLARKEIYYEVK